MAKKFTDYDPFTDPLADDDILLGVDVSDTTQSAQGSTKRLTVAQVRAAAPVQSVNGRTGAVTGVVDSDDVSSIVQLTQAEYDALSPPVATTLYIVVGL